MILPEFLTESDKWYLIEEIDPDWTDHFLDVDQALEFYRDTPPMEEALEILRQEFLYEA